MIKTNQILIILVLIFVGCNTPTIDNEKQQDKDKLKVIPWETFQNQEIVSEYYVNNFDEDFRKSLMSEIKGFLKNRINKIKKDTPKSTFFIDSIIVVNSLKDEIIFYEGILDPTNDVLDAFYMPWYGKKINNHWYFSSGDGHSIYKPNSGNNTKNDVHYWIKKMTHSYLLQDKRGELHINDNFFSFFDKIEDEVKESPFPINKLEKNRNFVVYSMREYYDDKLLHEVYRPSDFTLNYSNYNKELTINCPIMKCNEFPIDFQLSWYYNNFKPTKEDIHFVPINQKESSCIIKNVNENDDVYFIFSFAGKEWIEGVGLVYYHYKLSNGKPRFMGLVPDEADILDFPKAEQNSVRRARQKLINERLGKNYGK